MILISFLLFLVSLTVIVPAQFDEMWKVTILSTECGHLFAIFSTALLLLTAWRREKMRFPKLNLGLLTVSSLLFISPLLTLTTFREVSWKFSDLSPKSISSFTKTDFVYKTIEQIPLSLTLYENDLTKRACSNNCPVVVTIHGGSWHGGTREDLEEFNLKFLELGYKVVAISYRLAPKYHYPAAVDDCIDAVNYVRDHAQQLGVNPNQITLHGRSAGGHLALLVAGKLSDAAKSVKSVIAFYPITDFVWGYQNSLPSHIVDGKFVLPEFTGKTLEEDRALYEQASPLFQAKANLPPVLLVHGIRDELVSIHYSQALGEKLSSLKVPHAVIQIPWATHAFDYFAFGPGSLFAFSEIKRFLTSYQ